MNFRRMLTYAGDLAKNNNRIWFHDNYKQYQEAKNDFEELITILKFKIAEASPALRDEIIFLQPKELMYRIPRDMRYNRGKEPYNPSFRARFSTDRHVLQPLGYFLKIAPEGESMFGTGIYAPIPKITPLIREYIFEHSDRWEEIAAEMTVEIEGEKLKKVPKEYPPEISASKWMKHKSWFALYYFKDEELTDFKEFSDKIFALTEMMEPMREFLSDALAKALSLTKSRE